MPPAQTVPGVQADEFCAVHWTHLPVPTSQAGVPGWPTQPVSEVQGTQSPPTQAGIAGSRHPVLSLQGPHRFVAALQVGCSDVLQAVGFVAVHGTHWPDDVLQAGVPSWPAQPESEVHGPHCPETHEGELVPVQFAFVRQATQVSVVRSQYFLSLSPPGSGSSLPGPEPSPSSPQAVWFVAVHWTQRPVVASQAGVPGWPAQPESDAQATQVPPEQVGAAGWVQSAFVWQATHRWVAGSQIGVAPEHAEASAAVHETQAPETQRGVAPAQVRQDEPQVAAVQARQPLASQTKGSLAALISVSVPEGSRMSLERLRALVEVPQTNSIFVVGPMPALRRSGNGCAQSAK